MPLCTLDELARKIQGEVRGDGARPIEGAASLSHAGPRDITFAIDVRRLRDWRSWRAGACIVDRRHAPVDIPDGNSTAFVLVEGDPQEAFLVVLKDFRPQRPRAVIGISPAAHISPTASIGPGCNIYAGAYIADRVVIGPECDIYPGVYVGEDCRLGRECVLHPQAVLYADVVLGDRVIVHASAVLGADGFGYRFRGGRFEKIPQLGSVEVESDCEIGAGTTIDRGMIGATRIGAGTKLDNLVMIGHNCELGRHNAFASQVGLAGSVTTGDYVRCAGQVGIKDHVHLGERSMVLAKAGVHKDIPAGETQIGAPAGPEQEQMKIYMALSRVPEMRKQIRVLEQQVAALERKLEQPAATETYPRKAV